MDFDTYQEATEQTAIYPQSPLVIERDGEPLSPTTTDTGVLYTALGLTGEAGECGEKVKKHLREGDEEYLDDLEDELGDVLWYLARLAAELDVSLDDIAERNLDKLLDRQERDALEGEGDDR